MKCLSIPTEILYLLYFKRSDGAYIFTRALKAHFNRDSSQISQALKNLSTRSLINIEKVGKEKKVKINSNGVQVVEAYIKNALDDIKEYLHFLSKNDRKELNSWQQEWTSLSRYFDIIKTKNKSKILNEKIKIR